MRSSCLEKMVSTCQTGSVDPKSRFPKWGNWPKCRFSKKYPKRCSRILEAWQPIKGPKRGRRREELGEWGRRRTSGLIKEKWSQDGGDTGEFYLEDTMTACILETSLCTRWSRGHFRPSELCPGDMSCFSQGSPCSSPLVGGVCVLGDNRRLLISIDV